MILILNLLNLLRGKKIYMTMLIMFQLEVLDHWQIFVKGVIFLQSPPSYFNVVGSEECQAAMEELRMIEKK